MIRLLLILFVQVFLWQVFLWPLAATAAEDIDGSFGPASGVAEEGILTGTGILGSVISVEVDDDAVEATLPFISVERSGEDLRLSDRTMSLDLRGTDRDGVYASRSMTDPRGRDGLVWARRAGAGVVLYRFWLFSDGAYALFALHLTPDGDDLSGRAWLEVDGEVVGVATGRRPKES